MYRIIGYGVALTVVLASATASAQGAKIDNIGNAGGIVIGAERLAGVYAVKASSEEEETQTVGGVEVTAKSEAEATTTTFAIFGNDPQSPTQVPRLSLDYFPIDGLSIGASFIYLASSGDLTTRQSVSGNGVDEEIEEDSELPTESGLVFAPRIGYAVAFNETVGIWPRLGFSYVRTVSEEEEDLPDPQGNQDTFTFTTTTSLTHLTLEGLLFVSPFSNFAFVGGPFVDIGLGGSVKLETTYPDTEDREIDTKSTAYGFTLGIAAYFDTQ
jgi:hypothetical protein